MTALNARPAHIGDDEGAAATGCPVACRGRRETTIDLPFRTRDSAGRRDAAPPPAPEAADAAAERELLALGALAPDAAMARLGTSLAGLTPAEAAARLARHGRNEIARARPKGAWRRLGELFAAPLSVLLLILAIVSYATGETKGAIVIALMVVLSTLLSFVQEFRSGRAADRLRAMVGTTASVVRAGVPPAVPAGRGAAAAAHRPEAPAAPHEVPLADVVPGDVVHLSAGDIVPADVRIVAARDLFVNQATLTGESLPVEKFAATRLPECTSALALDTVAFMGTDVVSGSATAVVAATGGGTCFGGVARALAGDDAPTAFDRGVRRYILLIVRFMLVMVPLVFVVNGLTKGDWLQAFLFAVAVAVGLTPEMLPMIITINLAKGALAMSGRKVIVKRLDAIQNLGAMDVLCTDKTGTLTQNRVILERHVDVYGRESRRVLEYAYLNSYYQTGLKNLLDHAILEHADVHAHLDPAVRFAKVDEVPYDFGRRRMSVVVGDREGRHLLICKGAVEEVLGACSRVDHHGAVVPLDDTHHDSRAVVTRRFDDDGFRVIGVAYKVLPADQVAYSVADERDLVLAGFVAFLDPPKESAAAAIRTLHRHGVAVKVLSGDNEAVTRSVCRHVGIADETMLTGAQIDALDDEALAARADAATIFPKLAPAQKARVIAALHRHGHIVGYLGDGINDGPALKAADVGVTVDSAVDIARETADIVLLEKSLLVLDAGVTEGRRVFGNITKYIRMAASSNFGNMLSVLGASAFLPFLPMAPVQILCNNLLYDLSQTTVATDNVDAEFLRAPRRWDIANIGRYMLTVGPVSSAFDYATFATLVFGFGALADPALFQTGWFVESLLSQTLVVHVIRTGRVPFVQSAPSVPLLATTLAIAVGGVLLPFSPAAHALGLTPLPAAYGAALVAIVGAYLVAVQLVKRWLVRRFGLD